VSEDLVDAEPVEVHMAVLGGSGALITDKQGPTAKKWMLPVIRSGAPSEDFAAVTRMVDPTVERTVVMVAGIDDYGTLAAGEFTTDPACMNAVSRRAPQDWNKRNIQLVLRTGVLEDAPGSATLVDKNYW